MRTKKFENYSSPRWSGEILDCSMPMTFDQYDHCSFNCLYCFSYYQKALKAFNPLFPGQFGKNYQSMKVRSVNVNKIKSMFTLKSSTQFEDYIREKKVMQWGGLSDPFDMFEKRLGTGLELLKLFKELNYPLCFSTKGTWWLEDDRYVELFTGQKNWNMKFSIINYDPALAKKIELGVPSPADRIEAIRKFSSIKKNGGVTLRLRPFIIGMSDRDYKELIGEAADAGASALSMEFFCLETRATEEMKIRYGKMSEAIGMDIYDFYKKNSPGKIGYLRLNWKVKKSFVDECERLCRKYGMRFYVSDADHKDKCDNGCCCGLSEKWNYSRGQFTEALLIAKKRVDGKVYFSDIEPHLQMYKKFEWRRAQGYNTRGTMTRSSRWFFSMYDYIREVWNTPTTQKSPYQYFAGLLKPVALDEDKNVIYQYSPYKS